MIPLVLLSWVAASGFVFFGTRAELADALDSQADVMAAALARLQGSTLAPEALSQDFERYQDDYLIRLWDNQGGLLFDSQEAKYGQAAGVAANETANSRRWQERTYVTETGERILIARLGQETNEVILQIALSSLLPLGLAFLVSVVLVLQLLRSGLSPLNRLSDELTGRSASDLLPLKEDGRAEELQPITLALNGLFSRIRGFISRERRFVDDAAHEMRTPLTVIKAQCQAIDPAGLDPATRERIGNIIEGVDRMSDLSARLLDQARAEQDAPPLSPQRLLPLVRSVIADLLDEAAEQSVSVELSDLADPWAECAAEDLRLIVKNIAENAIKFAGPGGQVLVTVRADGVLVEDSGPGIPPAYRDEVFKRFVQLKDAQQTGTRTGTGLGLSIVRALSERNGMQAEISSSPDLGGVFFSLRFTPAAA
jgi:signal transduction histidine kinase